MRSLPWVMLIVFGWSVGGRLPVAAAQRFIPGVDPSSSRLETPSHRSLPSDLPAAAGGRPTRGAAGLGDVLRSATQFDWEQTGLANHPLSRGWRKLMGHQVPPARPVAAVDPAAPDLSQAAQASGETTAEATTNRSLLPQSGRSGSRQPDRASEGRPPSVRRPNRTEVLGGDRDHPPNPLRLPPTDVWPGTRHQEALPRPGLGPLTTGGDAVPLPVPDRERPNSGSVGPPREAPNRRGPSPWGDLDPEGLRLDAEMAQRLLQRIADVAGPDFLPLIDELRTAAGPKQNASGTAAAPGALPPSGRSAPTSSAMGGQSWSDSSKKLVESMLHSIDKKATTVFEDSIRGRGKRWQWIQRANRSLLSKLARANQRLRQQAAAVPGLPRAGGAGGGGAGGSGGRALFAGWTKSLTILLLITAVLIGLAGRLEHRQGLSSLFPSLSSAKPGVSAAGIVDRTTLVEACHTLARNRFGATSRGWHHRRLFVNLSRQLPQIASGEIAWLLQIYEWSRYARQDFQLSEEQISRARRIVDRLASSAVRSQFVPVAGGQSGSGFDLAPPETPSRVDR